MSAKDNSSPRPSLSSPPVSSSQSTMTDFSDDSELCDSLSDLEDVSTESVSEEEHLDEEWSMEEDESPEEYLEEEYLDEHEYLEEETVLQRETYLFSEAFEKDKTYLQERELQRHLEEELKAAIKAASQSSIHLRSPVSSISKAVDIMKVTPSSSKHELKFAISSFLEGTGVSLKDQSSQTEWPYDIQLGTPLRSRSKQEQDFALIQKRSQTGAMETFPQGSFLDTIINGPFEKREDDVFDDLPITYQAVYKEILTELVVHHDLKEDVDKPLSELMEVENRKRLGTLLRKNFEKYRGTIMWIMKKRDVNQTLPETSTITYEVSTLQEPPKPEDRTVARRVSALQKALELHTEWTKKRMKAHEGDGTLTDYPNGNIFHIYFPNSTGQIYYPSGNLALLISCKGVAKVTYIILEDSIDKRIRGLVTNSGHATFYDEDGKIWLSVSKLLGYYFPKDKRQKAWNWWNLALHVHAPPIMCITLKLNKHIHIQIKGQDNVIFCFFTPKQRRIYLNMGTKFKFVEPKLLQLMKRKSVLETDPQPLSWKIQALLGKISRGLCFLTLSDLEAFTEVVQKVLRDLSTRKSRIWF